jgi:hypothetical protein
MTDMLPAEEGTPLDWAKHEDEILELFVSRNKTLREVMEQMRTKHNFNPTYARHQVS